MEVKNDPASVKISGFASPTNTVNSLNSVTQAFSCCKSEILHRQPTIPTESRGYSQIIEMPVIQPPKGSTDAPATYKQPSRKGKKAWRKNVDVTEVEKGLEELNEEIIKGFAHNYPPIMKLGTDLKPA